MNTMHCLYELCNFIIWSKYLFRVFFPLHVKISTCGIIFLETFSEAFPHNWPDSILYTLFFILYFILFIRTSLIYSSYLHHLGIPLLKQFEMFFFFFFEHLINIFWKDILCHYVTVWWSHAMHAKLSDVLFICVSWINVNMNCMLRFFNTERVPT